MYGNRKVKQVRITPELIQTMLTQGNEIRVRVLSGLPETAIYTRAYYDDMRGHIVLVFYDDSFDVMEPGMRPQDVNIVFKRLD